MICTTEWKQTWSGAQRNVKLWTVDVPSNFWAQIFSENLQSEVEKVAEMVILKSKSYKIFDTSFNTQKAVGV